MSKRIPDGSTVLIDQGFDTYTEGRVIGFDGTEKNLLGWRGNYTIEITGGVDCIGRPAKIGQIITVLHSNVKEKKQ